MTIDEAIARFNSVAHHVQTLTFLPRDRELQVKALEAATTLLKEMALTKATCIAEEDEDLANRLLSMELALSSVASELEMYIDIKNDVPERAWDDLIDAQAYAAAAMRAHQSASHLHNHLAKLHAVEKLLFPPQAFTSVGAIVGFAECSICGKEYDECGHIMGRPYMGRMCAVICKNVQPQEVSLVTEPADKKCRVTHFTDEEGRRNKMTWKLETDGRSPRGD
jgi:hypothetical protein